MSHLYWDNLVAEFEKQGVPHFDTVIKKIKLYVELLKSYSQHVNIIGTKNLKEILNKHILDCALGYAHFSHKKSIADVGTGAGLPGLLLGILGLSPIYLIESKQKKTIFLKNAIKELGLKNVFLLHQNVNEIKKLPVHIITCRAFASIDKCLRLTSKMRNAKTEYIFYKGTKKAVDLELEKIPFKTEKIVQLATPLIKGERHLVIGRASSQS